MDIQTFRWSSTNSDDRFPVFDPSTGKTTAVIQGGGAKEIDGAVRAAHVAFQEHWRWRPAMERGALLQEIARRLQSVAEEIAIVEVQESGKTLAQARSDVELCIWSFNYFGGLAGKLPGEAFDGGSIYGITVLEPFGVVGAIIPFNWPPLHTGAKLAPALAVGNTVVIKPPEQTPFTILKIAEIAAEVLPEGVIQIVPGRGAAGAALAAHPLVRKISFTGAPSTGTAVLKSCAENHTPALMELGGKNALIVCEDADLDMAIRAILEAGYVNQGQACTAGSRVLVHHSKYEAVAERVARAVSKLRVGSGFNPTTHVGPLISAQQRDRVLNYIRLAVEEGACVRAQADLPNDELLRDGFFVAPTLLTNVTRDMRVAREEIFGPVVGMTSFESIEEAISIANDTDFGLFAGVFSGDQSKAMEIARRLDVGVVLTNNYFRGVSGMPFGGTKASGYGREHTVDTLKEYGRKKLITFATGLKPIPEWIALNDLAPL